MESDEVADVRQIVGVLAGESRARLWAAIVVTDGKGSGPTPVHALTAAQKRDLRALESAGLVRVADGRVSWVADALADSLRAIASVAAADAGPERFLVDGFLEATPRRAADREEVLRYLSGRVFVDPAEVLSETEVMGRLKRLVRDPVGIRRALVDHRFIGRERDGARYWLVSEGGVAGPGPGGG